MFNTREMNKNQTNVSVKFKVLESITKVSNINMLEVLNLGTEVQELSSNMWLLSYDIFKEMWSLHISK